MRRQYPGYGIFLLVMVLWGTSLTAHAALLEAPCVALFRQKQLPKAARCFQSKIELLPASKRSYRGRLARNAAVVWQRAAKASPNEAKAYMQQAILLYQRIVREKLCLTASGCTAAQSTYQTLCARVGCSDIKIVVSQNVGQVQVMTRGTKLPVQQGGWSGKLPPGSYKIKVTAEGYPSKTYPMFVFAGRPQKVSVSLPPMLRQPTRRVVVRTPPRITPPNAGTRVRPPVPQPKTSVPALAWVGYIGGGIALVGAGVLLGMGYGGRAAFISDRWQNAAVEVTPGERTNTLNNTQTMAIAGWAALGGAGLLFGLGITAHVLASPPPPKK